eukprot:1451684-Heterocapsa_arctica.AAC.1
MPSAVAKLNSTAHFAMASWRVGGSSSNFVAKWLPEPVSMTYLISATSRRHSLRASPVPTSSTSTATPTGR